MNPKAIETNAFLYVLLIVLIFSVRSFAQTATITTFAGRPVPPAGSPIRSFGLVPTGIAPDSSGGVYFTMHGGIFYAGLDNKLSVIASFTNGTDPLSVFTDPGDLALDAAGNLFVASANRIWKITPARIITVIAGVTTQGFAGDGGPANLARLYGPSNMVFDAAGNLFFTDAGNHRVRRISASGIIATIAGDGTAAFGGDNGPAITAQLNNMAGLAIDRQGNLYVSDWLNHRVRKISTDGVITTVAGTGGFSYNGDNIPATSANLTAPEGLTVDAEGNLYITDTYRIRRVTPDGMITTFAGNGMNAAYSGEGEPAVTVPLSPQGEIAVDGFGNIYMNGGGFIRRITPDGVLHSIVGNGTQAFSGDGGPAVEAQLLGPFSVAVDLSENVYISDWANFRLRKVDPAGIISTLDPAHIQAEELVLDRAGTIYYTRSGEHGILSIRSDGVQSVVAGSKNTSGFAGDGGPAAMALFLRPSGLALDLAGNLYVGDVGNRRIRKISNGIVTTLVSDVNPVQLAVDRAGNVYFASSETHSIYKVTPGGVMSRVAGNLSQGFGGDGGQATQARLSRPQGIAVDSAGNLYIADLANYRIRKVNTDGIISTIAGRGVSGYSGDGGQALAAAFVPESVTLDAAGNLYIVDRRNAVIRKVEAVANPAVPFALSQSGAVSFQTNGNGTSVVAGSAQVQFDSGTGTPFGIAIFSLRQNGVLISEGTVPAVQPFRSGRFYAEVHSGVNTGVAFANTTTLPALVSFVLTGGAGELRSGIAVVPARGKVAAFLDQAPFNAPAGFRGTFSFNANVPVAVVALRGIWNERGEFLTTTLPTIDTSVPASASSFVYPHFADGGGWRSQLVLVNPGSSELTGTVTFRDRSGNPVDVTIDGEVRSSFFYSVPGNGQQHLATSGNPKDVHVGSILVAPNLGSDAPSGLVVFSYRSNGVTVTEAGVPAAPEGTAFRLYVEGNGSLQTGLAVANPSSTPATLSLNLFGTDGLPASTTATLTVPARGQLGTFLSEVPGWAELMTSFQGTVSVASNVPITILGLRTRYNERGDFLITALPPINELAASMTEAVIPHFADGGGYTTEFVLFGGTSLQAAPGLLRFALPSGQPLHIPMR